MSKLAATTILCEVVTADGTAAWTDPWAGPGYRSFQATPPHSFDDWQPGRCPVTINHEGPIIGHVDYLETGYDYGDGGLYAVAVIEGIEADLIDGQLQCSPEIRANAMARTVDTTEWTNGHLRSTTTTVGDMHATEAHLDGIALVDRTAAITSTRVQAWDGDYRRDWSTMKTTRANRPPEIIARAFKAATWELRYRRPTRLRVHRPPDPYDAPDRRHAGRWPDGYEYSETAYHYGGRPEIVRHGGGYVVGVR